MHADGVGDDTAALQQAIDRVQETTRRGIVFLPEGRYRLTHELLVWSGIRLIGYGAHRPVLFLAPATPGYQEGPGKYLVHFASDRPAGKDQPFRDADPGTFYSAMSNIDIEIGDGNAAAVGIRSHFAQHCYLAHIDFFTGGGRAGVEEKWGTRPRTSIFTAGSSASRPTSPRRAGRSLLIDSSFDGQRRAAIETEEGGLTLVRIRIRDVPTAILVREERAEELWMKDSVLQDISGPALVVSDEGSARTQINLQGVVCAKLPEQAHVREIGREDMGRGAVYRVNDFCHGLILNGSDTRRSVRTVVDAVPLGTLPEAVPSDIPPLPPRETWVNVRSLGARGYGIADDTKVLRDAIASHAALYLPGGRYRVTDTLTLRPDTALIGLSPTTTQILISDSTPAFIVDPTPDAQADARNRPSWMPEPQPSFRTGGPKPMLEAPKGGTNIVVGLGLDTGGINDRAVALKWSAGEHSLVDDVRFLGGHGTYGPDGNWLRIYNKGRTGDFDERRRWDSQYWSLWVTDGGGGTFKGIWTPSTFASAGMYVSDTTTPGRIYALSSEHHVRNEVRFRNVSNWVAYDLQTEEERGESPQALPLEIESCANLTFSNVFLYRVDMETPFRAGIRAADSRNVHFRGLHAYSPGKLSFDNTLVDDSAGGEVRAREVAWLDLPEGPTADSPPPLLEPGAQVTRLAGGFTSIDGLVADSAGIVYFVDQRWNRIYRLPVDGHAAEIVSDVQLQPVALAIDRSGKLLVISRHGSVYALGAQAGESGLVPLQPVAAASHPNAVAWLPVSRWRDSHDWAAANTRSEPLHYLSADGSVFIPAPESFTALGSPRRGRGYGTVDLARTYALASAKPGRPFYVSDEFGQKTWSFAVQADGTLGEPRLFAQEGEAGNAVDSEGDVFVCAGQVFVYDSTGR